MKSNTHAWAIVLVSVLSLMPTSSWAINQKLCNFAPENDRRIPVGSEKFLGGLDQDTFNRVIARVTQVYAPIVSAHGGNLDFKNLWTDETVNSSAEEHGKDWVINAYGGLARHPMMTEDGMMMVFCHEMGHHLGGAPRFTSFFGGNSWAAVEGQADYFATMKCWRTMTANDDNIGIISSMSIPQTVSDRCAQGHSDNSEVALCKRSAMVGLTLASVLWDLGKDSGSTAPQPDFMTPDPSVVSKTFEAHPEAQCRLDTYFAGSVCSVSASMDFDKKDPTVGACAEEKGDKLGFRPECWYHPATAAI